jgi:hypothetical protein
VKGVFSHAKAVVCVAFSPDGTTILTGSKDNTAQFWDVATSSPIGAPLEHGDAVVVVAFRPDGKMALSPSRDKTVRLWDPTTGKPLRPPLVHQNPLNTAVFSPDGQRILTGTGEGKRLPRSMFEKVFFEFRASDGTGQLIHKRVFLRHDGSQIVNGTEEEKRLRTSYHGEAVLWDVATGTPLESPPAQGDHVSRWPVQPPDLYKIPYPFGLAGGALRAETTLDRLSRSGPIDDRLYYEDPDQPVQAAAFSPDGKRFLLGLAGGAIQVDALTRTLQNPIWQTGAGPPGPWAECVAYSPTARPS